MTSRRSPAGLEEFTTEGIVAVTELRESMKNSSFGKIAIRALPGGRYSIEKEEETL